MSQSEYRDALFTASDNRENFKQIIAKRSDLVRFSRGRLAPSLVSTYQYAGLVLGYATSGGDAGYYKAYAVGSSDGSQVAVGVLAEDANVGYAAAGPGPGSEISIIRSGELFKDLLIGLDAGAITNLDAKSYVEGGVNLIQING